MSEATTEATPEFWYVRVSNPQALGRALFRSVSEQRARSWVETHVPHGEEVYLESPSGEKYAYHKGRLDGKYGVPAEEWAEFDPSKYVQPNMPQEAPQSAWADLEG